MAGRSEENVDRVKYMRKLGVQDREYQSPINLNISRMMVLDLKPISWYNHDVPPKKLKLTNTGHTVIMSAKWQVERPFLADGPFVGDYVFSQTHFHWGINDMEGSEHHIDGGSMPMELHAVHFKSDYLSQEAALREADGIAVLVYMFKVTKPSNVRSFIRLHNDLLSLQLQSARNPNVDPIVKALPFIQQAHASTRLTPQPITSFIRPFMKDYIVYWGTVQTASCSHSILWVISREPIGISTEQVAEFRTINGINEEPLLKNCREIQEVGERTVVHVSPSGYRYATLLPIPRDPPPRITGRSTASTGEVRKHSRRGDYKGIRKL